MATLVRPRRLPGLYFEAARPSPGTTLPRMDIAGFIGFARSGPVGVPVPVEDPDRFRDIFGPPLPLAWNAERGAMDHAHLARAVDAFFANGGRRCWVVRVAEAPIRRRFPVPGLIDAAGRPVAADARSPGSWAGGLRTGAALEAQPLRLIGAEPEAAEPGGVRLILAGGADPVRPGDLLRLGLAGDRVVFVEALRADATAATGAVAVTARPVRWARTAVPLFPPPTGHAVRAVVDGPPEPLGLCELRPAGDGRGMEIELARNTAASLVPGAVVHLALPGGATAWVSVGREVGPFHDLEGEGEGRVRFAVRDLLVPYTPEPAEIGALHSEASEPRFAERLRFALLGWRERSLEARLDRLGFTDPPRDEDRDARLRSRYWALLPRDEDLFARRDERRSAPLAGALAGEVLVPRFPLAGPSPDRGDRHMGEEGGDSPAYLPLGMPTRPGWSLARGPVPVAGPVLEQDGLADFHAGLFADPELVGEPVHTLLDRAFDRRHIRHEALRGLHALLPVEEVSLVALPDLVQAGWRLDAPPELRPLEAPAGLTAHPLPRERAVRIRWTHAEPGLTFEMERAARADFGDGDVVYRGEDPEARLYPPPACVSLDHVRVRAVRGGVVGPWSATLVRDTTEAGFETCVIPLTAPAWVDTASPPEDGLAWAPVSDATKYRLEGSGSPAFGVAAEVIERDAAAELRFEPATRAETRYYRVRAERDGAVGPWSTTRRIDGAVVSGWRMIPAQAPPGAGPIVQAELESAQAAIRDEQLAVQRAALRLCAARGDVTVVLALPERYRQAEVREHVAALTTPDPASSGGAASSLRADEMRVLSYGAVYHPWVLQPRRADAGGVESVPPDGAMCGIMASHALERGPWLAPANVPLRNGLGTSHDLEPDGVGALLASSVNALRSGPGGVRPVGADTLSATEALRFLGARRLLILLRRLLDREGERIVFESNTAALRDRLRLRLNGVLESLHRAGAFAGVSPEQAFRIDVGTSLNPIAEVERGRLLAEVRVAPSKPLAFVTIRLVQHDDRAAAEEV